MKTLPFSHQLRLAAAVLAAMALIGAAPELVLAQNPELAAPPAAPAFYTQGLSRVRDITGDSFLFSCDGGREVRVRLFDADCAAAGPDAISGAKIVAARLLEESPFWVFPVGQTKAGATDEVWADVWTSKGWLSQTLIKAGYAQRQSGPANQTLSPIDPAGMSSKGPAFAAPAFFAPVKVTGADAVEVQHAGKAIAAQLFGATSEGVDASKAGEAAATASKLIGAEGAWVLPCGPQPSDGKSPWPVRIWTREGGLSEVLIKAGQAGRASVASLVAAAKPAAAAASPEKPAEDKPKPERKPRPETKPAESALEWQVIPVSMARKAVSTTGTRVNIPGVGGGGGGTNNNMESDIFKVTTGVWRVTYEAKPVDKNIRVSVQINRCQNQDTPTKGAGMQAAMYSGEKGMQGLRTAPGSYWIKASGTTDVTVKVEELVRKAGAGEAKP